MVAMAEPDSDAHAGAAVAGDPGVAPDDPGAAERRARDPASGSISRCRDAVEMLEQVMVRRALDRAHGHVEEAARLLGISRKGLFLKRRRWGLHQAS